MTNVFYMLETAAEYKGQLMWTSPLYTHPQHAAVWTFNCLKLYWPDKGELLRKTMRRQQGREIGIKAAWQSTHLLQQKGQPASRADSEEAACKGLRGSLTPDDPEETAYN